MKDLSLKVNQMDLVSLMDERDLLIEGGFKMGDQDDPKEDGDNSRFARGVSEYTRIISSSNPGYVLGRKI